MYISDLLKKFQHITPPDIVVRKKIVEIVKEITNIELDKKDISVKNGVVFIKTTPIYKNEIFINKQTILSILKQKINDSVKIVDIK